MRIIQGRGETINALKFADDIAFCAETEKRRSRHCREENIIIIVNKILWDSYGM